MKTCLLYCDDKKYNVTLTDKGEPVAYYVEVYPRGKRTSMRLVWSAERHGWHNGDIPPRLKAILNVRGAADAIARCMGW